MRCTLVSMAMDAGVQPESGCVTFAQLPVVKYTACHALFPYIILLITLVSASRPAHALILTQICWRKSLPDRSESS
jgi:hypothetical protein